MPTVRDETVCSVMAVAQVLVLGALLVVRAAVLPIFGFLGAELRVGSCQRSIS